VAWAANSKNLKERMKAVNARIESKQKSLGDAMKSYQKAANDLQETEQKVAAAETQIQDMETQIESSRALLNRQVDFIYRTRGVGYLEMLFSASDVAEFANSLEWLAYIADSDARLISDLKVETTRHTQALEKLNTLLDAQAKTAAALKKDVGQAQSLLTDEQAQADALNSALGDALEREQRAANERAAARKKPAAPSVSSSDANSDKTQYVGTGMVFTGIASWYGKGSGTASGERFNPDALTAAHKTLPFGTLVQVTYQGKSVVVRINDRGPYSEGRVIDISRRAAEIIGLKRAGLGKVSCEVVTKQ